MLTLNGASDILQRLVAMKTNGSETRYAYLALSTTPGQIDGSGIVEPLPELAVDKKSYERVLIGRKGQSQTTLACFTEPEVVPGTNAVFIENNMEIHFNEVQEENGWGEIKYFAIYESATGGTPIYVGELTEAIVPAKNTVPLARKGNIRITLAPGE